MLPATFKRLCLHGLLAVVPLAAAAQIAPPFALERPSPAIDSGDLPDAAAGMPAMPFAPPPTRTVRKLSDSELTCAQIYAESQALEKSIHAQEAESAQTQAAMAEAQNDMMKQANAMRGGGMGMGSAIGSGLLGMIPGASLVQGYAMQAAAEARANNMQDNVNKMMQVQGQMMKAEQALEHAQARSDHLTDLFLKKGCKLSEVRG